MPDALSSAPLKKLPPPTTIATCTPWRTASAISPATLRTTMGSRPTAPPPNISPDNFSKTRRATGGTTPDSLVTSGMRASSLRLLNGCWVLGSHTESGEADHRAARGLDELAHRGLRVLGERLLDEHVLLVEAVHAAFDDLRKSGLRLALVARGLLGDTALVRHHIGGNLVTREIQRRVGGDVHRH